MTNQVKEIIYYLDEKLYIDGYPPLPKKDPRVIYIEGYQGDPYFDIPNTTMCWRRYIGTWSIKGGKLYLCHLEGWYQMATLKPILADWYSETLTLEKYQSDRVTKRFELEIDKGCVKSEKKATG